MKVSISILCVVLLLCLVGWTSYGQKHNPSRATWDYLVKVQGSSTLQQVNLGTLGAEGWELTAVTTGEEVVGEARYPVTTYYFKRQK